MLQCPPRRSIVHWDPHKSRWRHSSLAFHSGQAVLFHITAVRYLCALERLDSRWTRQLDTLLSRTIHALESHRASILSLNLERTTSACSPDAISARGIQRHATDGRAIRLADMLENHLRTVIPQARCAFGLSICCHKSPMPSTLLHHHPTWILVSHLRWLAPIVDVFITLVCGC